MALVNIRLNRGDNSPWGFRLQGGKDFGQPLLIQKVNGGSLAERGGLAVGDALIRVNGIDVQDMRHKEAQDVLVKAGNNLELSVQRGPGSTWRPHVSPVGTLPSPGTQSPHPVTKTSLAAKAPTVAVPSGHNVSPRPFGGSSIPQMNGGHGDVKAIVNKQYNSPVGIYSEDSIAETLSAQAEVLAPGVLGVNFMKNEKTYDSQRSEVFKMVQEVEKEPKDEPDYVASTPVTNFPTVTGLKHVAPPESRPPTSTPQTELPPGQNICADCERLIVHAVGGRATSPRPLTPLARQMGTPEPPQDQAPYMPPKSPLPDSPVCSECGKHVVGVFVRIKDKNLHVECFKCATCGTSLKNVGYYTINNKLYCDIHAKLVARQNPPAPNLDPITVPPGGRAPSGAFTIPSSNVTSFPSSGPLSPQPGTLAPMPFHAPRTGTRPVTAPRIGSKAPTTGPKPFGTQSSPSTPTSVQFNVPISNPAPPTNVYNAPKTQTEERAVVWPPATKPPKHPEPSFPETSKKLSLCSEEVSSIQFNPKATESIIYEAIDGRVSPVPDRELELNMRENLKTAVSREETRMKTREESRMSQEKVSRQLTVVRSERARSASPDLDTSTKPHEIKSLLPPASAVRPMSPYQVVVFPPEVPLEMLTRSRTPTPKPTKTLTEAKTEEIPPFFVGMPVVRPDPSTDLEYEMEILERKTQNDEEIEAKSQNLTSTRTVEESMEKIEEKLYTKEEVENIVKEEIKKVSKITDNEETKEQEISVEDLPPPVVESGQLSSALTTAADRPFTPVPFPKPLEIPSLVKEPPKKLDFLKKITSDKPVSLPAYSKPYFPPPPPPPDAESKGDRTARAFREVGCPSPMTDALTTAPARSYSPLPTVTPVDSIKTSVFLQKLAEPPARPPMTMTSALTIAPKQPFTLPGKTPIPIVVVEDSEEKTRSAFKPTGNGVSSVIPKSTPLERKPLDPYIPCPQPRQERSGVERTVEKDGGKTTEKMKAFEEVSSVSDSSSYSRKAFCEAERSNEIKFGCVVAQNPPPRAASPRVRPPGDVSRLLPFYQQNIGEIPVRNRSISPVPHPIRAPQINPQSQTPPRQSSQPPTGKPVPWPPSTRLTTSGLGEPASIPSYQDKIKSRTRSTSPRRTRESQEQIKSETQCYSSKSTTKKTVKTSSLVGKETVSTTTSGKQLFKPDIPARSASPSWKANYVRSIQNLSPITVRLPSPVPPPLKPKGEITQTTSASVVVKEKKDLTSNASLDVNTRKTQSGSEGWGSKSIVDGSKRDDLSEFQSSTSKIDRSKEVSSTINRSRESTQSSRSTMERSKESSESSRAWYNRSKESSDSSRSAILRQKELADTIQSQSNETFDRKSHKVKFQTEQQFLSSVLSKSQANQTTSASLVTNTDNQSRPPHRQLNFDPVASLPRPSNSCGVNPPGSSGPNAGAGGGVGGGSGGGGGGGIGGGRSGIAGSTAPRRGRGILNAAVPIGGRIPLCGHCNTQIRGPFITALGKIWCPDHFVCVNSKCRRPLQDIGFVEESEGLYCEFCFEQYLAPTCDKCNAKIKGDCLNAIGKHFHPECFRCAYCEKLFGNNPFFLEDGLPYCENDWNELFTTKCFSCGFPIEAGDRWVEALNNNYHSQCFNCTMCKTNLEGQSFFAKGGRPFCRNHAR